VTAFAIDGKTVGAQAERAGCDFDELVRRHQSMVFSLSYHFLHDRETAEEVAQEVFLALHRHLAEIESPGHAEYWLRKVAAQRSIDEARRRKRRPQVALEAVAEPAAKVAPEDPMLGEVLRRLIATLPEAPRMVMVMRYQEDLDPMEIAKLLEMPVATVKSHLQRSLALLREKLERRGKGER
jgi:RNA polymerase sigma-70 factor, ECF subfamily